jgi:PIN domain nuclease of toxin-antitoxin system
MVLLDTHVFVWLASDPGRLSKAARDLLAAPRQSAAISLVTAWEIALLSKRGLLELPLDADTFIARAIRHHRLTELPLSRELILRSVGLPDLHNDPFDRILVATARARQITLISKDRKIAQYPGIEVIW